MRPILLAMLLAAFSTAVSAQETPRILSVTGEGQVEAVPDMANITLGVVSADPSAGEAMAANAQAMQNIMDVLTGAGIEARDIQTGNISLNPRYADRNRVDDGRPEITGYVASTDVRVRIRDVNLLGTVLDDLTNAGVNQINGIGFGLSDPEPTMDEARKAAVADGMEKAKLYADAAGVTLGDVIEISEGGGGMPGPMPMARAEAMAFDMPVAAGEMTVSANVTMRFTIE